MCLKYIKHRQNIFLEQEKNFLLKKNLAACIVLITFFLAQEKNIVANVFV